MWNVDGNLGAEPNPPHSESNAPAIRASVVFTTSTPGTSDFGSVAALLPMALTSAAAFCSRSLRRFTHTSVIALITWRNAGFGKYVPPQKGRPSASITTVIGQPPRPVRACTASM